MYTKGITEIYIRLCKRVVVQKLTSDEGKSWHVLLIVKDKCIGKPYEFVATHKASYVTRSSVCSSEKKPTGQYHIYTTVRYFDLRHRWATMYVYAVCEY